MERANGIYRLILVSLLTLSVSFEYLQASTTPIAEGNTWVYKHSDTLKDWIPTDPMAPRIGILKDGLFTMRMDSVIIRTDTVFFNMAMIDSGVNNSGSVYNNRTTTKYMSTNNSLYKRDSANGFWVFSSDEFMIFNPHRDTSFSWIVVGMDNEYMKVTASFSYSRNTDSSLVIVNSANTSLLHTTDTVFSWENGVLDRINKIIYDAHSRISTDTLQWIDSIGVFYHIIKSDSVYGNDFNVSTKHSMNFKETYRLLSFHGSPVSIAPINTSIKNVAVNIRLTAPSEQGKFIFSGEMFNRQGVPTCYFNLLGRKVYGIKHAQLLIIKSKLSTEGQRNLK
jgi:hypothetical protein